MKRITLTIEDGLFDRVEKERGDVSRSRFVCRALTDHLDNTKVLKAKR